MANKDRGELKPKLVAQETTSRNFLLAIAIDEYEYCSNLNNAVYDVESFIALITRKYLFNKENIVLVKNKEATKRRIEHELARMVSLLTPSDNLVVYFSGHGRNHDKLGGYWIPTEAKSGYEDWPDYLSNGLIKDYLSKIKSLHTFLIVDSCFSGALFIDKSQYRVVENRKYLEPSRWGLTSGKKEIVSDGVPGQHSPFSEALLNVLENADQPLGVMHICEIVLEKVIANTEQTPIGSPLIIPGHQGGEFVFFLKPNEYSSVEFETEFYQSINVEPKIEYIPSIFIAYSHTDKQYLEALRKSLSPLIRNKKAKIWFDGEIRPGDLWDDEITSAIVNADIILLLVSTDSLHSDYFYEKEVSNALKRHENNQVRVIPILLTPCLWDETPLNKLQVLPAEAKPITSWKNLPEAWDDVARGIRSAIDKIIKQKEEDEKRRFQEKIQLMAEKEKEERIKAEQEIQKWVLKQKEEEEKLDELAWQEACLHDERSSFEAYMNKFPEGKYFNEAKKKIETIKIRILENETWQVTLSQGTIDAYSLYLTRFPNGEFAKLASQYLTKIKEEEVINKREEEALWDASININTIESYNKYLQRYPNGSKSKDAQEAIANFHHETLEKSIKIAFEEVKEKNSIEAYQKFIQLYPHSSYIVEANLQLIQLQKQEEEKKLDEATWKEAHLINGLNAFKGYLNKFPEGNYAFQAKEKIAAIEAKNVEDKAWSTAQTQDSQESYESYLVQFPKGGYVEQALAAIHVIQEEKEKRRKDEELWNQAVNEHTIEGYKCYVEETEAAFFSLNAEKEIKRLERKQRFANYTLVLVKSFNKRVLSAIAIITIFIFVSYSIILINVKNKKLKEEYQTVFNARNIPSYKQFRTKYPNSKYDALLLKEISLLQDSIDKLVNNAELYIQANLNNDAKKNLEKARSLNPSDQKVIYLLKKLHTGTKE
ncbi:MAG: TIR domain-containing protein [Haliscomenobacter sp.]|uniref:TIR domain-containing protein n=1 Tax=Haliscomenobacter sp. TaxID=2717303 RepID=UPI0029AFD34B|nr:TIR domain-containing protein [Haliscomenobacter sp.]MDX2067328.1 TIR domain-containing protein [Haliscomenobacter sp.]